MSTPDICFMTATELARRIRAKELPACVVMEAHLTILSASIPRSTRLSPYYPNALWLGRALPMKR